MKHIPRILNCAAVKVFAVLEAASPSPSRTMVSQVAVCRRNESPLYAVYYCDEHWRTLHGEMYDSMDRAIGHAQQAYPELNGRWLSPQAAVTLRDSGEPHLSCAFCGHRFSHAGNLMVGQRAAICHRCLDELYYQHHEHGRFVRYQPDANITLRGASPPDRRQIDMSGHRH